MDDLEEQIKVLQSFIDKQKALQESLLERKEQLSKEVETLRREIQVCKKASEILIGVANATQESLEHFVEDVVSFLVQSVFPDTRFELQYATKRNQSEAEPFVVVGNRKLSLRSEVGCGLVDVAAFGFRLVLWALQKKRSRPIFLFDEPFRFVSRDLAPSVAEAVRLVVKNLDLQVILITHSEAFAELGDRVFSVVRRGGVSHVEQVKE